MTTSVAEPTGTTTKLKGIRRTAARRMIAAWEAPVFHVSVEVDMTAALKKKAATPGATVTDVLLAACARALTEHPSLNAHYADESVTMYDRVNLGIAVATDAGLVVPVIHDVQAMDVSGIAAQRREVVAKARAGKLGMAGHDVEHQRPVVVRRQPAADPPHDRLEPVDPGRLGRQRVAARPRVP